ncbi:MAG: outer membrane protein assembly factor BamD [Candidatus Omnitrophica bacterium]|nr:outer membrane protein assembly factor BamD [Candidatus Omnitrophota bacterium]
MKKIFIILVFSLFAFFVSEAGAFWIWTPESGKWINPKYSIKDTPKEQYEWGMRLLDLGEYNQAIKKFKHLIKKFPESPYAARSQCAIGLAYEKKGKIGKAIEEYHKVSESYPYSSEEVAKVIEAEYRLGNLLLNREGGDTWQKIATFEGNYERAALVFEQAIKISPFNKRAPEMQYKSGDAYFKAKKYEEAITEYNKVLETYADSEWVDEAVFKLGFTAETQGLGTLYDQVKTEEAITWYSRYLKEYPEGEKAGEAKERMGNLLDRKFQKIYETGEYYEKEGEKESALIYYRRILKDFPGSTCAEKARKKIKALK